MKKIINAFLIMALGAALSSCEVDVSGSTDNPIGIDYGCSTTNQTDIRGMENDQWTQLDYSGNYQSQIHLTTVLNSNPYTSVQWNLGPNRQTCTTGTVSQSGSQSYLQLSISPTAFGMQVIPGLNYIDYQAYGCTPFDCSTPIESGTIVLYVNYLP